MTGTQQVKVESFEVLGIRVDAVQRDSVLEILDSWKRNPPPECQLISSTNVNNVMCSLEIPVMRTATNNAGLSLPDSVPFLWLGRLKGFPLYKRCGIQEIMMDLFEEETYRHFFFGNTPEVLNRLKTRLHGLHPRLQICGMYSPPFGAFSREQNAEYVKIINESRPDFVWVSLGCPRQEMWIEENRGEIKALGAGGAGAVFDFLAGGTSRAPEWIQYAGLEWFYRLTIDPKQLWRRYLVRYPKFVLLFLLDLLPFKKLRHGET
jgi:N-acetylglucosaminyldiphosphoundecaprenol N-acetyl-beta-D-mannosaminyltransferase